MRPSELGPEGIKENGRDEKEKRNSGTIAALQYHGILHEDQKQPEQDACGNGHSEDGSNSEGHRLQIRHEDIAVNFAKG
jgi:hypothetical protein